MSPFSSPIHGIGGKKGQTVSGVTSLPMSVVVKPMSGIDANAPHEPIKKSTLTSFTRHFQVSQPPQSLPPGIERMLRSLRDTLADYSESDPEVVRMRELIIKALSSQKMDDVYALAEFVQKTAADVSESPPVAEVQAPSRNCEDDGA